MQVDRIGFAEGRVSQTRVLPPVENEVTLEISFQGAGELLGIAMTDMGTSQLTFRTDGMIQSDDGNVVIFGAGGEVARLKAAGLGRLTGPVPQGRYTTAGMFETTSPKWQKLNEIIGIFEFIVSNTGDYRVNIFAWK